MNHQNMHYWLRRPVLILMLIGMSVSFAPAQTMVTNYAGDGIAGLVNGDTASCRFKAPDGMCTDPSGNLFIADGDNHCIRKITPSGIVTTYAGTGIAGYADGVDSLAQFRSPFDVCVDGAGNVYVSDFENQYIRKISPTGMVSTVAGNGIAGYADGPAAAASFNYPRGIVVDASGNLYVSDSWNHRIRKVDVSGEVSTYAGGGTIFGVQSVSEFKDGSDTTARFYTPCGLSIDGAGNIYVADAYNHRVRRITPSRVVTTIAGTGISGASGGGFQDGDTSVARFNTLTELYVAFSGSIYVSDTYNNRVRLVKDGTVSTVAGIGVAGFLDGPDTIAKFNHPRGLIADSSESYLLVCDGNNRRIRRVSFDVSVGVPPVVVPGAITVYPNPSAGLFYVAGIVAGDELYVMDLLGREVFSGTGGGDIFELNISAQPSGIYIVTVASESSLMNVFKVYKN